MNVEASSVYYLHISLTNSEPLIWRDVVVPSDLSLENLHYVIQTVMGWANSHAHQFITDETHYNDDFGFDFDFDFEERHDEKQESKEQTCVLSDLLTPEKSTLLYEYDLGDSWMHLIELKKILPANNDEQQIRCIKGKQACPPEGCGGMWGYSDLLSSLQYTQDDQAMTPFGRFNPDDFDVDAVNLSLKIFNVLDC